MDCCDPYDVLGLNYPCSKDEIKARYHELARKHHPDKLQHLSADEIYSHEQELKRVNLAYELLTKKEYEYTTKNEWKNIWENMDILKDPDVMKQMKDIFENVISGVKKYATSQLNIGQHYITLDVSLDEIYQKKEKRLRLFLKDTIEPVFISINCASYPFLLYDYSENVEIHITFNLIPHQLFSLDTLFDTNDMFCTMYLSIYEFVKGTSIDIEYFDGSTLNITIPSCSDKAIIFENKGLHGEGKLTVFIKVILPQKADLDIIGKSKTQKLLKYLKKVSDAHHSGIKAFKD